ncbi:MAG: nucleotidyl transferase AbiEii/AbiGii toxin family protein [Patescibacteria group bacterium]
MTAELLSKAQLGLLNRSLGYPLAVAEKDYFLALASKVIYDSELKDKLIFKGDTALYHTYLPQLRFSEDLDYSTHGTKIVSNDLRSAFEKFSFFEVKKQYDSPFGAKLERLSYNGPLGQPGFIKLEVDTTQNVVLPARNLGYRNNYGLVFNVKVMDIREIMAEKLRAMSERVRYRDFYDFCTINKNFDISMDGVLDLAAKKEIRSEISVSTINSNWELALKQKDDDIFSIHISQELNNDYVYKIISGFNFKPLQPTHSI